MKKKLIISVSGFIGAGKDTVAEYLISRYSFQRVSYASSLKDAVSAIFGWDRKLIEGGTPESREWRECVDTWWSNRLGIPKLTPRWVLQHIGTDVFRMCFNDDIWVASVENQIIKTNRNVVITDCRFKNEIDSIKNLGGITIRVQRGYQPEWADLLKADFDQFKIKYPNIHSSEYSGALLEYDHYINNDGCMEDLHAQIRVIINPNR